MFYHYDGLGSTRALSNETGTLTDSYDYEAFGETLNEAGNTLNNYKYTGEQHDSSLNQYYLRARYYDQGVGRFTQMDTWAGVNKQPVTLNKYLYAGNDPVLLIDPSGYSFRSSGALGRAVEANVEAQYLASHLECSPPMSACSFGSQVYHPLGYLKPDILNFGAGLLNEIKPLTPGGIASGIPQIRGYAAIYGSTLGILVDDSWTPSPAVVAGYQMYYVNVDGLIFYSTDDEVINAVAVAGSTLATVKIIYRQNSFKINAAMGAGAVITAGVNIALRMRMAQTVMMPATMAIMRF